MAYPRARGSRASASARALAAVFLLLAASACTFDSQGLGVEGRTPQDSPDAASLEGQDAASVAPDGSEPVPARDAGSVAPDGSEPVPAQDAGSVEGPADGSPEEPPADAAVSCGAPDQACCDQAPVCEAWSQCNGGTCESCGGNLEPCCESGPVCQDALGCVAGACVL